MIGKITGTPSHISEKFIIVDVSGVGYKVFTTPETIEMARKSERLEVFTYMVVREDAIELYGFQSMLEKDFFELLLSVSGVGPRSALGILSVATVSTLQKAIGSADTSYLTKVSGIGRKTAEKIVVELRDKLALFASEESTKGLRAESDIIEALKALGYSHNEAREATQQIPSDISDMNQKIKEALKILAK
jgi:Holliday junction DNA helicase RuvA